MLNCLKFERWCVSCVAESRITWAYLQTRSGPGSSLSGIAGALGEVASPLINVSK